MKHFAFGFVGGVVVTLAWMVGVILFDKGLIIVEDTIEEEE